MNKQPLYLIKAQLEKSYCATRYIYYGCFLYLGEDYAAAHSIPGNDQEIGVYAAPEAAGKVEADERSNFLTR